MRNIARLTSGLHDLGVAPEAPLPTEFRLFKAGANDTTKGVFTLDADAMAEVLSAFELRGVELVIDLNHDSTDADAMVARADASDARGWFKLADRNGELWAVDVTWTPDGM